MLGGCLKENLLRDSLFLFLQGMRSTSLLLSLLGLFSFTQAQLSPTAVDQAVWQAQQETDWLDLYLYVGGSEDWNQTSAAWDEKRVPIAQRASIVRRMLPQQSSAALDALTAFLTEMQGVDARSIQRYWIAPVIRVKIESGTLDALARHPLLTSIHLVPGISPDEENSPMLPAPPVPGGHEPAHEATGATSMWSLGYSGYGRKVYIIDAGVDPGHPALGSQYWGNFVPTSQAWYEPGGNAEPRACGNHGTLVAGVILGMNPLTNDTTGMAPGAVWMASPPAGGSPCAGVDILAALQWALDPDGDSSTVSDIPDVINNSWSIDLGAPDGECSGPYRDAMAALEAAGIAIVFSAGNTGPGAQSIPSPKNLNINPVNVFSVGSVNGNNATLLIANSSSRGPSTCLGGPDSIKPEVVAPGVSVRTTGLNNGYNTISGTSFAAPQVSGAVLLLKEAFPTLSGKQILESLYYSATDLGVAGEDNTYGNGMISLPAAFAWLMAQGHVPLAVNDSNDIHISDLAIGPDMTCDSLVFPVLSLQNTGPNDIESLVAVRTRNGLMDTLSWQGLIAPGANAFWGLSTDTVAVGNFQFSIEIILVNGKVDQKFLNNHARSSLVRLPVSVTEVTLPPLICADQQVIAKAQVSSGEVWWYDDPFTSTPFSKKTETLIGPFQQSSSVYVARQIFLGGGKTNLNDTGNSQTDGASLFFDVDIPFRLLSVEVISQGDGNRRIQLIDGNGTIVEDTTVYLNIGRRRISLNFDVPAGNGLALTVISPNPRLFTTTSSVSYPYSVPALFAITGSSLGADQYPYFYDWEVQYEGCRSQVNVAVGAGTVSMDFSPRDTTIYLALGGDMTWQDLSNGISSNVWEFGDGTDGTGQMVTHVYDSAAIYPVYLTGTSPEGCSASAVGQVQVVDWALSGGYGSAWTVTIYPNPAKDRLMLSWQALPGKLLSIEIYDMQGRRLMSETVQTTGGSWPIDLRSVATGSYVLRCVSGDQQCIHRFVREE